jgi:hypothetical protein
MAAQPRWPFAMLIYGAANESQVFAKFAAVPLEHIQPKVHAGLIVIGGPRRMSKKTKEVRKTAKKAKKAAKKIAKDDQKVDASSVPPKAPFST